MAFSSFQKTNYLVLIDSQSDSIIYNLKINNGWIMRAKFINQAEIVLYSYAYDTSMSTISHFDYNNMQHTTLYQNGSELATCLEITGTDPTVFAINKHLFFEILKISENNIISDILVYKK